MSVKIFDMHTLTLMFCSSQNNARRRQPAAALGLRSAAGRGPAPERQNIYIHS
jgi:hypothetical protein